MAINKVVYGTTVLVDLTNDTVRPEAMLLGTRAHACNGDVMKFHIFSLCQIGSL